jgi:hypothetical protein
MTDRPILFSAEMVRAILDGRKTQTRRAIKPVPTFHGGGACHDADALQQDYVEPYWVFPKTCKYGKEGDTLWVRETWGAVWPADEPVPLRQCEIEYRADLPPGCTDRPGQWPADEGNGPEVPKWRPSIHMPRWASRITLRITDIRVERLQDISEDDARAEGSEARPFPGPWWQGYRDLGDGQLFHQQAIGETAPDWMIEPKKMPQTPWLDRSARDGFRSIWMGLHGPDAWDPNPWVWVISFERVKP